MAMSREYTVSYQRGVLNTSVPVPGTLRHGERQSWPVATRRVAVTPFRDAPEPVVMSSRRRRTPAATSGSNDTRQYWRKAVKRSRG